MLLSIRHTTEFSYEAPVSESVIELRMAPRTDARQTLRGFGLAIGPSTTAHEHIDWLGNRVHQFSVLNPHTQLAVVATSAIHVAETPLDWLALEVPLDNKSDDHRVNDFLRYHGAVQADERLDALESVLGLSRCTTYVELLKLVYERLGDFIKYQSGVTTSMSSVSEVLTERVGVCQDFTHVALALLRRQGVPARYVSGYLAKREGEAEMETHAWVEAFVPGVGWFGIDPTHGIAADEQHIAVGTGRSYADVPPNRGMHRGNATETIDVSVEIRPIDEVPIGLLAPRAAPIEFITSGVGQADVQQRGPLQQQHQQQQQVGLGQTAVDQHL